jgi:two-component system, LytTR family, response regulator
MHFRNPVTVLIAVEHALFREGIRLFLAEQVDLEVVGEAAEAVQMLHAIETLHPEVLILDFQMAAVGGLEILTSLGQKIHLLSRRAYFKSEQRLG